MDGPNVACQSTKNNVTKCYLWELVSQRLALGSETLQVKPYRSYLVWYLCFRDNSASFVSRVADVRHTATVEISSHWNIWPADCKSRDKEKRPLVAYFFFKKYNFFVSSARNSTVCSFWMVLYYSEIAEAEFVDFNGWYSEKSMTTILSGEEEVKRSYGRPVAVCDGQYYQIAGGKYWLSTAVELKSERMVPTWCMWEMTSVCVASSRLRPLTSRISSPTSRSALSAGEPTKKKRNLF